MNGIKVFIKLLIFTPVYIAAIFFTGCSFPIGSLQELPDTSTVNQIRVVLNHLNPYKVNEIFKPLNDVKVYGIFGDVEVPISVEHEKIVIKIIGDPSSNDEVIIDDLKEGYKFKSIGTKSIVISLSDMVAPAYNINVEAQETNGSGTGLVIIWPKKE
jgi:hypothetical protein